MEKMNVLTFPDGSTYEIADAEARQKVSELILEADTLQTEVETLQEENAELNRKLVDTPLCYMHTQSLQVAANNEVRTITTEIPDTIDATKYELANIYIGYQYGDCVTTIRRYWKSNNTVSIEFTATIKQQAATAHIVLVKKTLAE